MKVQFPAVSVYTSAKISRTQGRTNVGVLNNSEPLGPVVRLSFKGRAQKNKRQIVSIAASDSKLGSTYMDDASGTVRRISTNLVKNSGMDARTILPYYSYNNADGRLKVLKIQYDAEGKRINSAPENAFKSVPVDYELERGEKFVVQSRPFKGKSKFIELEQTGIFGNIDRLRTEALEPKSVPYSMFEAVNLPGRPDRITRYILYTPKMAVYDGAKAAGAARDLSWNDFSKAAIDALPKLNTKEFGNFNPVSLALHRRFSFPAIISLSDSSANGNSFYNGLRVHLLMYMPDNANYGKYKNPLKFLRMIASTSDWEEIKKLPDYEFLKYVDENYNKVSKEDIKKAEEILKPFLSPFKDPAGGYSLRMAAVRASEVNPDKILLETPGRVRNIFGSGIKLDITGPEIHLNMSEPHTGSSGGVTLHKPALTPAKNSASSPKPWKRVVDISGAKSLAETAQEALKAARATFWGKVITTIAFMISVGGIGTMIYLSAQTHKKNIKE